jgi:uncharacterized protein (TIGR03000 family)
MAAFPAAPAAPAVALRGIEVPAVPVAQQRQPAASVSSRITVKLPPSARLFVNDDPCPLTSDTRSFNTPSLKPDRQYSYTLRAEIDRGGQTFSEIKKVVFESGKPVTVEFRDIGTVRTAQR